MAASSRKCPKKFSCYERGKLLGSGAFANVYACRKLGTSDNDEQFFAVKAVDLQAMRLSGRGERELKKLQREANILKRVKPHINVVQFVDLVEHEDWYLFILEFVQGGNLLQSITRRQGSEPLKEHEVLDIFRQLVEGIQHLHSEAVIHRDLKLENVLVVQEGNSRNKFKVKITDFGLSKEVGDGMSAACSIVGSPKYVAPEVLASGTHDFKADIWSLGILLFVLLSSRFPFDGNSQAARETQENIDAELRRLPVSDAAQAVMRGLLRIKAEERLSLEALSSHEWLNSANTPPAKAKRRKAQASAQDGLPPFPSSAGASGSTPAASSPGTSATSKRTVVDLEDAANAGSEPSQPVAVASLAAVAAAATPTRLAELPKEKRRRSWVDCSPEEAEAHLLATQAKLQVLIGKGFESVMAEIALNSADGDVDTAIALLEGS